MRRVTVPVLLLSLVLTLTVIPLLAPSGAVEGMPRLVGGGLDAGDWDFGQGQLLPLNGEWRFFPNELLHPDELRERETAAGSQAPYSSAQYLQLPTVLNATEYRGGTLVARVVLPRPPETFALKLRYFSSAHAIYIDGVRRAEVGRVSLNQERYQAAYIPHEFAFEPEEQELELVVQFANFHHRRIRLNEVLLGSRAAVQRATQAGLLKDAFLLGALVFATIYYAILFLIQRNEPANLYLSVIALVSAARLSVVGERILVRLLPTLHPELMMKIGFAGSLLMFPLLILYLQEIFRSRQLVMASRVARYWVYGVSAVLLLTPLRVYDLIFQYLQVAVIIMGFYTVAVLLSGRLLADTQRSGLMAAGGAVLLLTGANDVLRELNVLYTPELFSAGVVAFLFLQGVFLAWRFHGTFLKVEALSEENSLMVSEIRTMNRELEARIAQRTRELEMANLQLERLSRVDPLTDLANRRAFDERYSLERSLARREGRTLSALMIDIDAFKPFNDNYGHPAGDACLRRVAKVIRRCCNRGGDFVARYGGEEFVLLLPGTDTEGALALAERIRTAVEALQIPHEFSPVAQVVTVSIGVASDAEGRTEQELLIHHADQALYMAKASGRNCVHCKDPGPESGSSA